MFLNSNHLDSNHTHTESLVKVQGKSNQNQNWPFVARVPGDVKHNHNT